MDMTSKSIFVRLDSIALVKPARRVLKGQVVPFIDMAAVPTHARDITRDALCRVEARGAGAHFQNGDTLLARITPCLENGKTAQVRCLDIGEIGEGSTEFIVLAGADPADNDFVYYLCCHPLFREYAIGRMDGTSGRQRVSGHSISSYQFTCPAPAARRSAAKMLGSIDDRIDLLRETNATLEAIAQALFKSWFVDFDPVRAKNQGLAPSGMDRVTAALFPDRFQEAVPVGWRAMMLSDAFDLNPPRSLVKGTVASYLDMASLATSGHCVETPLPRSFTSGSKFRNGDSLLARITPCLENGKSAFVDCLAEDEVGWGSTEFIVLRPKPPLPMYFGYLLCRHLPFREHAIHSMAGTSGRQRVQNDVLGRYILAVPDSAVASAFGALVEPLQRKIAENHAVGRTLATLRDTLLPRLISGQLRSPDATAQIAEAIA